MRDRRAAHVAAEALELGAVARWDGDLGVHVDAAALAHALGLAGACRVHDTQQWLARSIASEAVARGRCTAEGRERELLADRLHDVALAGSVDRAAVTREDLLHALRCPGRDISHLVSGRRGERVEDELTALRIAHVNAIQRDYMKVDIKSERRVPALNRSGRSPRRSTERSGVHHAHGAGERIGRRSRGRGTSSRGACTSG